MSKYTPMSYMNLPCCEPDKDCCFKDRDGGCYILNSTKFDDNRCHFRKEWLTGPNLYDREMGGLHNITIEFRKGVIFMSDDALWIGVSSLDGPSVPALNVFRKHGDIFELVKVIEGEDAIKTYKHLVEGGEADVEISLSV